MGVVVLVGEKVVEVTFFEFLDGFVEDFVVHVVAYFADEAALFGAKYVAGAAYVEVAHSDVETAAYCGEFLYGTQTFLGLVGKDGIGGYEHVAECFAIAASHAAAHLVQVAEAELLRVVDNHGVGVGYVETILDDRCRHKHIYFAFNKTHHGVFHLFAFHLAVGYGDRSVGYQAGHEAGHFGKVFDAVADEEHLTVARQFIHDGVADKLLAERGEFGLNGLSVGRWCLDHAEVASAHE